MSFHGNGYGSTFFNLDSKGIFTYGQASAVDNSLDFYAIHGIVLIIAWIGMNFVGIMFAMYYKHLTYWVQIHRLFSGGAAVITVVVGFMAVAQGNFTLNLGMQSPLNTAPINVAHRIIGIIMIALSIFQLISGNLIYYIITSESLKTGWIHKYKHIHRIAGLIMFFLAMINLGLGFGMRFLNYL